MKNTITCLLIFADLLVLVVAGRLALYTNTLPSVPPVIRYLLSCDKERDVMYPY